MAEETNPRGSSRGAVFFIEVIYLVALGVFVVAYRVHWIEPRKMFFGPVPFLVPWFGAVGGAVLSLTGVFDHRGRDWKPAFCYWHWARPLVGAIVATVSVLIFQSGILAVGGQLPTQTTATNTKNLLYYVVAFVVGYREDIFRQLIRRFADVILTPPADAVVVPVIESLDPPQAAAGQETQVIISGSGFSGTTGVNLADAAIAFAVGSDTQLTATIPADAAAGETTLSVTSAGGTASTPFTVTAAADTATEPVIESLDPPQAAAGQETQVIISGSGFSGTTGVNLADAAIAFAVGSDTQLTATIPADAAAGETTLSVTSAGGTASTPFTVTAAADTATEPVIESLDPPQAAAGQETQVIISGSGFSGTTGVNLADAAIAFAVGSDTQLTATIPADAAAGETTLSVTSAGGTASTPFTVS